MREWPWAVISSQNEVFSRFKNTQPISHLAPGDSSHCDKVGTNMTSVSSSGKADLTEGIKGRMPHVKCRRFSTIVGAKPTGSISSCVVTIYVIP